MRALLKEVITDNCDFALIETTKSERLGVLHQLDT